MADKPPVQNRVPVGLKPLSRDAEWESVLARYKQEAPSERKLSYRLFHRQDRDPRHVEISEAKRHMLFAILKNSYADRRNTYLWAALVLLFCGFVLMPFLGVLQGYLFAAYLTLSWIVLHATRKNETKQRVPRR